MKIKEPDPGPEPEDQNQRTRTRGPEPEDQNQRTRTRGPELWDATRRRRGDEETRRRGLDPPASQVPQMKPEEHGMGADPRSAEKTLTPALGVRVGPVVDNKGIFVLVFVVAGEQRVSAAEVSGRLQNHWNRTAWNRTAWNRTAWNRTAWNRTAWNRTARPLGLMRRTSLALSHLASFKISLA
ncbi:hypothetical protein EYF80_065072 [Liparis tanakae]|uniref:Uncharacterized protein n=1 Tax=Liparis tanakae TaxID=230148 RepID=A0A4Z2E915_9TELE|nr:hypothetical protein EYF80_065072 [Liparis tanakae]